MSTVVDKRGRSRRVSAGENRAHILGGARLIFYHAGFDQVGVRELAAAAGVDPAIVIRLFGSKEALFSAAAEDAFELEAPFDGPLEGLGRRFADHMMSGAARDQAADRFDEFNFLLGSGASPVAGPILSAALHAGFVDPLARHLGGEDAAERAALLTACILGFATLKVALGAPALEPTASVRTRERLGALLQVCIQAG